MIRHIALSLTLFAVVLAVSSPAFAQGRGGRGGFGPVSALTLAGADEVKKDLKLTDEQNTKIAALTTELNAKRGELFQSARDDRPRMMTEMAKQSAEFSKKLAAVLDEAQNKRLTEIYVQVNGASSLQDESVAAALKLSDEQKTKLKAASDEVNAKMAEAFRDFQNLSDDERRAKGQELRDARDKALLAVLDDAQKAAFEDMSSNKLEIDRSKLQGGFGGGRRPGGNN